MNFFLKSAENKAMSVVSLVVVILALAFFNEGNRLHSRTIDQVINEKEKSIDATVTDITLYSLAPYEKRLFNLLATHKEIPEALVEQDRERLYQLTLPLYEALKRENEYLHVMHYHLPDGRSFLRMHNPKKFPVARIRGQNANPSGRAETWLKMHARTVMCHTMQRE